MTPQDRQMIGRWNKLVKEVMASTDIEDDEQEEERDARIQHLEADPEEWFKYYFPRFAYAPAARFHKTATARVIDNPEWCEVRLWSRELAKRTRTMMEVF